MRILLIEDDSAHATIIANALSKGEPEVSLKHASDGASALALLQSGEDLFDLILLDLKLPRIDGHQILQQIKTDERFRSIPVVALTTSVSSSDLTRAYDAFVNSYLVKPIDFLEFQDMILDLKHYWARWNQRPTRDASITDSKPSPAYDGV